MNNAKYRFTLNMQSPISQRSLPVKLGDTARSLYVTLVDGGTPYSIPQGYRAVFFATKPDGTTITNDCVIEGGKTVKYDFSAQTANVSGVVECELRVYGGDGKLVTSPSFSIVVSNRVVYDDSTPLSESEATAWDNILLAEQERVAAEEKRKIAEGERTSDCYSAIKAIADMYDHTAALARTIEGKLIDGEFNGKDGADGKDGEPGKDYVLTSEDRVEIANYVLMNFPVAEEVSV